MGNSGGGSSSNSGSCVCAWQVGVISVQWSGILFVGGAFYFLKEYYFASDCQNAFMGDACFTFDDLMKIEAILMPIGFLLYFVGIFLQLYRTREFVNEYIFSLTVSTDIQGFVQTRITDAVPVLLKRFQSRLRPQETGDSLHRADIWENRQSQPTITVLKGWGFYRFVTEIATTYADRAVIQHFDFSSNDPRYSLDAYLDVGSLNILDPALEHIQMVAVFEKDSNIPCWLWNHMSIRILVYVVLCLVGCAPILEQVCRQTTLMVPLRIRKHVQSFCISPNANCK